MADTPAPPPGHGGGAAPEQSGPGKALGAAGRFGSTVLKLVSALERLDRVEAKLSATTEKLEARLRALEDRVLVLERDAHNLVGRATVEAREQGAEVAMRHLAVLFDRITRLETEVGGKAAKRKPRRDAPE